MESPIQRYDSLWESFNSDVLKRMATLWGGSSKMRKDECILYLKNALNDPQTIDAGIARMRPYERAALSIIKLFGNTLNLRMLDIAIRATGVELSRTNYGYRSGDEIGRSLTERGIVMPSGGSRYIYYGYGSDATQVFTDDRILARVPPLECLPLRITAAEYPGVSTFRREQNVLLDVISIVRTLEDIGGIGLKKSGEMRSNDLNKFAKKLGWGDHIELDGMRFPEPSQAYLAAMTTSGLLVPRNDALVSSASLEQIGVQPTIHLLRSLTQGTRDMTPWIEYGSERTNYWLKDHAPRGRLAILTALRCLPDRLAWVRFEEFERALFDRIGEVFAIGMLKSGPYKFRQTDAEYRAELEKWRAELRASWIQETVPWLQAVFQTWLYAFGLVEVSLEGKEVDRFRLTDVGRALLWDETPEQEIAPPQTQTPAWVVQPNFDVVVYLGSASTEQVAFLEHHAERLQVAQHTAQYRLTRDSVYGGLQRGSNVERLLSGLAAGSRVELPGNVVAEIRTWASLRERIRVRRQADLIEFSNAAARQRAIESGTPGLEVGERFLLLPVDYSKAAVAAVAPEVLDYTQKPPRCLLVTEEGLLTCTTLSPDLLTPGFLEIWAERKSNISWQLTQKSVLEALRRGRTLAELMAFLRDRLLGILPEILVVALRSWAGEKTLANIAETIVLQCPQSGVLDAILASQTLKPYLLGRIGPDAILVRSSEVEKVRDVLKWAGIQVSAKLTAQRN